MKGNILCEKEILQLKGITHGALQCWVLGILPGILIKTMACNVRNVLMKPADDPNFRDTLNREENKKVNMNWMILR